MEGATGLLSASVRSPESGWSPDQALAADVQTSVESTALAVRPDGSGVAVWLGLPPVDGRLFALSPASVSVLGSEHELPVITRWNT